MRTQLWIIDSIIIYLCVYIKKPFCSFVQCLAFELRFIILCLAGESAGIFLQISRSAGNARGGMNPSRNIFCGDGESSREHNTRARSRFFRRSRPDFTHSLNKAKSELGPN